PGGTNSIPPVEYVEMKQAGEFQVIDFAGNVVRPGPREDVENAPFRSMQDPEPLQGAVRAWHGRADWSDWNFDLRPWGERARDVDNEATRLLRRLRERGSRACPRLDQTIGLRRYIRTHSF